MTLLAGKYRIERVLGQGGMGVVVAAVHVALDERVAIKLLLPEALGNAEVVARFQREARAAVRIKSEHVARVLDVGTVDPAAATLQPAFGVPFVPGAPFMVMEYLEGQDLAAVLRATGPLPVSDAVAFVAQAIEAIAEAHALGIVHRDIKPSNLFLARRPDGTPLVKVLDFGISKAAIPGSMDAAAVTTTSAVLGSPMYMAPEQMISSREVDARTDVWSLGVVLYQLLTGRGPFNGTTMTELCARILQEPHAPIRASRADVPPEIEAVVARCLEKDRTHRFASVADLAEAIAPFGGQSAALAAERARRLLPRTERAVVVPAPGLGPATPAPVLPQTLPAAPQPAAFGVPYAATNGSWSATRGRAGGSSGAWVAIAIAFAMLIAGAGVVVLVLAMRARDATPATGGATTSDPTTAALPAPTAPSEPSEVQLAPLHPQNTTTAATSTTTASPAAPPPALHAPAHRPPHEAATTAEPKPEPPPPATPTTTAPPKPKPDIF
jgi:hypothetical protein